MNVKNFIKHPLGIVAIVLTFIVLTVLLGTPYLIEKELNKWIVSRGPDRSQSDNVDFNPFTGRFALYNLQVERPRGQTLHIPKAYLRFSWKNLFKKRLYLHEIVLEDTYLLVDTLEDENTGLRVAGLVLKELTEATEGETRSSPTWGVGIDRFEIRNSRVEYDTPQLVATYHIDSYELTDLQSWNKEKPVQVEMLGRIDDSPIHIGGEVTPFADQLKFIGNLKLEQMELSLISKIMAIEDLALGGTLDIDINVETVRQQDKLINFLTEGDISIGALQLTYGDMAFTDDKVSWQGTISGNKSTAEGSTFSGVGKLSLASLDASLPSNSMSVQIKDMQLQGSVNYEVQKDSQDVKMAANLAGASVTVNDTARDMNLVDLKEVRLNTIDIQSLDDMSIAEIILQKLAVYSKGPGDTTGSENAENTLLLADNVNIKDINYKDFRSLSVSDITMNVFQAYLKRQKEGGWYLLDTGLAQDVPEVKLEKTAAEPEPVAETEKSSTEQEPAGTPFQFSLGRLQVENESSIQFVDESNLRPFLLTVKVEELEVADIDTVDIAKPVKVKVSGKIDEYSKIIMDGTLLPFAKPMSMNMKGEIRALRMPPLSSYTGQTIGYNLTSGQLDADLNMIIDKGNFAGNNELRMRNLEVARVDPEKVPEIDTQMKMPLESGLSMLRDKKDVIKLEIKLEGNIANPQFNFQDAINQAIAKAMTFASISYLKYTLQPFGTFIAVAELAGKAGKMATKVQLDPVQFGAAEISLDETAKQYLEKVAIILNDRPKLRLEVCGKAVENDRTVLLERRSLAKKDAEQKKGTPIEASEDDMNIPDGVLQDFAKERAKLVKGSLVKDHGVSHERIYLCLPAIDEAPDKEPYVEMLID